MSIALEDATDTLRTRLLGGGFAPGERLREVLVADTLGVSRTLARLAMSALEHEGLLVREPNRGSRIRSFTIDQIADAVEVRGELEGMAARLVAERGLDAETDAKLEALLVRSEAMLRTRVDTDAMRDEWVAINQAFHDTLIDAAGNWALRVAIDQVSMLPLVSARAIIFDRRNIDLSQGQLETAHRDHRVILAAVRQRHGHRAEARMREHAFTNAQNKRANLADPEILRWARDLPGGPLIATDPDRPTGR